MEQTAQTFSSAEHPEPVGSPRLAGAAQPTPGGLLGAAAVAPLPPCLGRGSFRGENATATGSALVGASVCVSVRGCPCVRGVWELLAGLRGWR